MDLRPGQRLTDIAIDRGLHRLVPPPPPTNSRIEDLRAAAAVLAGRVARVPGLVSPGSSLVKRQAEEEGLDRIFTEAGLEWVGSSGCSNVRRMNGDVVAPGERCALHHENSNPQLSRTPQGSGRRATASD